MSSLNSGMAWLQCGFENPKEFASDVGFKYPKRLTHCFSECSVLSDEVSLAFIAAAAHQDHHVPGPIQYSVATTIQTNVAIGSAAPVERGSATVTGEMMR